MQGLTQAIFFASTFICMASCKKQEANPLPPSSPSQAALLSFSKSTVLHVCPEKYDGYSYCSQPHTYWTPGKATALGKIGDSVYSRVYKASSDSASVFLIESVPAFFDCAACQPLLSAVVLDSMSRTYQIFQNIGSFGREGKIQDHLELVQFPTGEYGLRTEWTETNQGLTKSGVAFVKFSEPGKRISLELEGDNSGICDSVTVPCYQYKYSLPELGTRIPASLTLAGSGTRIDSSNALVPVSDTTVIFKP